MKQPLQGGPGLGWGKSGMGVSPGFVAGGVRQAPGPGPAAQGAEDTVTLIPSTSPLAAPRTSVPRLGHLDAST